MKKVVLALISTMLFGCGGEDGAAENNARLSVSTSSVSLSSDGIGSAYSSIPFNINQLGGKPVYLGIIETGSKALIQNSDTIQTSESAGELNLTFKRGYEIGEGFQQTHVDFYACYDEYCNSQVKGSPFSISINMTVSLEESITGNITEPIEIKTDISQTSKNVSLDDLATLAGSQTQNLHFRIRDEHRYVYNPQTSISNTRLGLDLKMENPSLIDPGVYSGMLHIDACYDPNCAYPIKGSPVSYNINYSVGYNSAPPEGSSVLNTKALSSLSHNVLEAEYIDDYDTLVISSDTPENAVYVYDVINNTSQKFPLSRPPTSLALDNITKIGRIAVGHDALVTVIDYNKSAPATSQISTFASANNVFDLAIKGDHIWIMPSLGQWVSMETIEISSGTRANSNEWTYYEKTLLKLHPKGNYLYTMNTPLSPRDIAKTDLRDPLHPVELYDSPYHGDYNICPDFWFSNNGNYIYTQCGVSFRSSDDKDLDMTYAGTLPLMIEEKTTNWTRYYDITFIESSNDGQQLVLIDDVNSGTLRYVDSNTMQETAVFTLANKQTAEREYKNIPRYAFYTSDSRLLIISQSEINNVNYFSLLQVQ